MRKRKLMAISFPALNAVQDLIAKLVKDYGWTHQYATGVIDRVVFKTAIGGHAYGVERLFKIHGAQAIEEAVRRLRQ